MGQLAEQGESRQRWQTTRRLRQPRSMWGCTRVPQRLFAEDGAIRFRAGQDGSRSPSCPLFFPPVILSAAKGLNLRVLLPTQPMPTSASGSQPSPLFQAAFSTADAAHLSPALAGWEPPEAHVRADAHGAESEMGVPKLLLASRPLPLWTSGRPGKSTEPPSSFDQRIQQKRFG